MRGYEFSIYVKLFQIWWLNILLRNFYGAYSLSVGLRDKFIFALGLISVYNIRFLPRQLMYVKIG